MGIPELAVKLEALSQEDYNMVVMLVDRLTENPHKPSQILKMARKKYLEKNPMSMHEIDEEIEAYRREKRG